MISSGSDTAIIANRYITTVATFCFSLAAACLIVGIFRLCGATPEIMVLTGVALGVSVGRTRLIGMLFASFLTAVVISFLGIIGFVGLVVPHMVRMVIGSDHRFLLPATFFGGALMLTVSDTAARLILAPHVLPVSILTAFMGAPVFIYLILRGHR